MEAQASFRFPALVPAQNYQLLYGVPSSEISSEPL
jgi:hypothetical protein